jgi:ATP-dependent protease ClpP protease subunit
VWCVPFFSEVKQPFVDQWLHGIKEALDAIRSSDKLMYHCNERHTILIPINSPGGDTDLLKQMLLVLDNIKSDIVTHDDGTQHRRIEIVTYCVGKAASCAFVLFTSGDICLSSEAGEFMCHEPMTVQPGMEGQMNVTTSEDAQKHHVVLRDLKQFLYEQSEFYLLERMTRKGAKASLRAFKNDTATLADLRTQWAKKYSKAIMKFYDRCRDLSVPAIEPPDFPVKQMTIFDYIVDKLAGDTHHKWIPALAMEEMGLCNRAGIDLHLYTQSGISIKENTQFTR